MWDVAWPASFTEGDLEDVLKNLLNRLMGLVHPCSLRYPQQGIPKPMLLLTKLQCQERANVGTLHLGRSNCSEVPDSSKTLHVLIKKKPSGSF